MSKSDMIGRKFGRLTVIGENGRMYRRLRFWDCRCQCGVVKAIRHDHLNGLKSISCGCAKAEALSERSAKHGGARRVRRYSEYDIWRGIIRRCHDPKSSSYGYYGARGIAVSEEWLASYATFLQDVGPRPSPAFSLERKDNDGPYSRENCVWATREEQANNKRNNVHVEIFGTTKTVAQWKREIGIEEVFITAKALKNIVSFFEMKGQPA